MAATNVYLYGAFNSTVADSYKAKEYLDSIGVQYVHLFYGNEDQLPSVVEPINTWFPEGKGVTAWPFVTWDEDGERKIANGLKGIKAVNFNAPQEEPAPAE